MRVAELKGLIQETKGFIDEFGLDPFSAILMVLDAHWDKDSGQAVTDKGEIVTAKLFAVLNIIQPERRTGANAPV